MVILQMSLWNEYDMCVTTRVQSSHGVTRNYPKLSEITVITITVITLVMPFVCKVIYARGIAIENALLDVLVGRGSVNIAKFVGNDRLCFYSSPNSRRSKFKVNNLA